MDWLPLSLVSLENVIRVEQGKEPFLLVLADNILRTGNKIFVDIKGNAPCAVSAAGRKAFEAQKEKWVWAAGGLLTILELTDCTVALTRYRDAGAPSDGDRYTLGSGMSSSLGDLFNPTALAVREGIEEFIIGTPDGIMVPYCLDNMSLSGIAASTGLKNFVLLDQFKSLPVVFQKKPLLTLMKLSLPKDSFDLFIYFERTLMSHCSATVSFEGALRSVNVLMVAQIKLPYSLDQIAILDGETKSDGQVLNGEVVCFPLYGRNHEEWKLDVEPLAAFKDGERITRSNDHFRVTTPLRAILEQYNLVNK